MYVNPRNEIKKGGPQTSFRDRGGKSTPLGLYILLRKAMRRNCTTILRNTKSDVQKSGNIRKSEVIHSGILRAFAGGVYAKMYLWYQSFIQVKIVVMVNKSR